jgi:hypothetical protein
VETKKDRRDQAAAILSDVLARESPRALFFVKILSLQVAGAKLHANCGSSRLAGYFGLLTEALLSPPIRLVDAMATLAAVLDFSG